MRHDNSADINGYYSYPLDYYFGQNILFLHMPIRLFERTAYKTSELL